MTYVVGQTVVVQAAVLLCGLVSSYVISDVGGRGRVFDGIGAISGGSVSVTICQSAECTRCAVRFPNHVTQFANFGPKPNLNANHTMTLTKTRTHNRNLKVMTHWKVFFRK